ncbi:S-layer homology domain-containing protein [Rossellomorea vietnamensis]|uniref:S-layer homology domain-containing protein n=1 Tax=Rossellomorea vietnamensis TaxID=218284 RepID=UPI00077C89BD|nr:S-layer homology domain-containing protein [Rossellomorea vietnamensis]
MAYKSKSYRKFLATGTTAALVASAIAPAASAADHPFTDVNTNYDEAVSYLYSNNITKGYTETTFGTYMSLTRGNAAVIIANALELDTTSATDAGFEDVNSRVAGAVNALVEAGIMDGFSDTEFRPDVELSRGAMAKILVNAYDLQDQSMDTPFTDLTSTFGSYIEALYGAGITTGKTETTFGTNQEILRGEFAVLLYKSINFEDVTPDVSTVKSSSSTEFTVNFEEAVEEGVKVEDLKLDVTVVLDNGTEVTPEVTGAELSEDRKSVTIMHKNNDLNGLKGQIIVNGVDAEFDYSQPKVASVMAVSGKELVVKFNQAVDKTDAEDLTNYSLTGVDFTGTTPVVSKDGKTVTLTAENVIDVTNATLQIDSIKTKADTKVLTEKYVTLFSYKDTAAPTVATVEAKGTQAVVTFSEALVTAGTVSLDGSVLSEGTDYVVNGKTLTIKNLKAEKSYKLDVVGAKDAADNMAGQTTVNFTVAKADVDNSKPTVSSAVTGNKLTLTFSEEVTPGKVTIGGTDVASDKLVASEDKMTYTVDVQDADFFSSGVTFFTKEVVVSGFTDGSNTMDAAKFNATFTADKTAPGFVSASIKTVGKDAPNDVLLLTFDDVVKKGDLSSAKLAIKSIDGIYQSNNTVNLSTANVAYGYDLDGKDGIKGSELNVLAITVDTKEKSSYSFELAGKVVADVYGNTVADTVSFSAVAPEYTTTPSTDAKDVTFTATPQADNMAITLNFNKSMSDSAVNASNYMLGGKSLPAGTTVKFVDNRSKVVITLPQGSVTANGAYALVGTNLTDQNGNTLVGGKVNVSLTLKENIVPTASKITLADSKTFMVDFSESVKADTAVTGVTVKVNNVALASGKYTVSVENGDLKVVTTDNLKTTDSLTVEFKNTNLVDANGNAVANSSISK